MSDNSACSPISESDAGKSARAVSHLEWWRMCVLWPLYAFARVWGGTLRFRVSEEHRALVSDTSTPLIAIGWHNRFFMTGEVYRRYRSRRRMAALVSASKDGAWLAAYFRLAGLDPVRGSSSWRGTQAVRELFGALQAGRDVAITPDGPRGPCYVVKPGALLVARRSQAPLLLISAHFRSAWRMRSWDGFFVPWPFSVVELQIRRLSGYDALALDGEDAAAGVLERNLREITTDTTDAHQSHGGKSGVASTMPPGGTV